MSYYFGSSPSYSSNFDNPPSRSENIRLKRLRTKILLREKGTNYLADKAEKEGEKYAGGQVIEDIKKVIEVLTVEDYKRDIDPNHDGNVEEELYVPIGRNFTVKDKDLQERVKAQIKALKVVMALVKREGNDYYGKKLARDLRDAGSMIWMRFIPQWFDRSLCLYHSLDKKFCQKWCPIFIKPEHS